jgi:aspartate aminotransferase-like enzyme
MDNWSIDVVISASQKGFGGPIGLSIIVAGQRDMEVESCMSDSLGGVDGLSRSLRHARSLSPHTMPAEKGSLYLTQLGCYVHRYYRWLFVMKACEGGSAAYFATPPPSQLDPCLSRVIVSNN